MATSQAPGRLPTRAGHLLGELDAVYFLLFTGWEKEMRGNRWHFAVRWAGLKPVVLVIPDVTRGRAKSVLEPRIPNCRMLKIHSSVGHSDQLLAQDAQVQVGEVLSDLKRHGFERPLLWCYNPNLAGVYAQVPAVARLFHASEAYFDFAGLAPSFYRKLHASVAITDLTVAVSDGVAASISTRVEGANVVTVANGCDYRHYSSGKPDAELAASGRSYRRVAIYAGNINDRMDFELLSRLATANPDVLFALYGPVSGLAKADKTAWKSLLTLRNVLAPGPVDPVRLPDLYAAADVGIIPYRRVPWLINNGLPLKALEMCAAGTPVVSSLMKPLLGMADGLIVTSTDDEFLAAFARTSRTTLSADQLTELSAVSSANDYDKKFDQILAALADTVIEAKPVTRVDRLIEVLGPLWFAGEERLSRWLTMPLPLRILGVLMSPLVRSVPAAVKRRLASNRVVVAVRELRGH